MRHTAYIILLATIFSACGRDHSKGPVVAPELKTHVDSFFLRLDEKSIEVPKEKYQEIDSIDFGQTEQLSLYGKCYIDKKKKALANIRIQTKYERNVVIYLEAIKTDFPDNWEKILEVIVYHELIHCIYEKDHDHSNEGIMAVDIAEIDGGHAELEAIIDDSLQREYIFSLSKISFD